MIKTCPSCGSPYIGGFRMGTQQVEDLVKKRFPQARVLRMDLDTTKNKDGHEKILSAFANEEADILIGTQMIVKGHDFPGVTLVGILAGFAGGVLDEILMKITLVFQAFPAFVLSIAIAGILGVGLWNGVLALSAVYWTTYARLSRSLVVSMKQENYIYAARMNGVPLYRMITAYILPNMMGSLIVTAAMDIGSVILSMAGLSFLGLGAARPTAEWGAVMSEARDYLQKAPWIIVFNGLALFLVVTVFQLFGDRLSEFVHKKEARTEN